MCHYFNLFINGGFLVTFTTENWKKKNRKKKKKKRLVCVYTNFETLCQRIVQALCQRELLKSKNLGKPYTMVSPFGYYLFKLIDKGKAQKAKQQVFLLLYDILIYM